MRFLTIILFIFCACSKGLDDDMGFVPKYNASFFLIQNAIDERSISCISKDGILVPNWEKKVTNEKISHFIINQSEMFICTPEKAQIQLINLEDNSNIATINWQNAYPTTICLGKKYLLALDNKNNKIAYFKRKNNDFELVKELQTHAEPISAIYHSVGRFYIQIGQYSVGVYDEAGISEVAHYSFMTKLIDLTIDGYFNIQLTTNQNDSLFYTAYISVTNRLPSNETLLPYSNYKLRYTPFNKPIFETEYLGNVALTNNIIHQVPSTDSILNFEVDFNNSTLFYQRNDSLYQYDLQGNKGIINRFLFENQLLGAEHYYERQKE